MVLTALLPLDTPVYPHFDIYPSWSRTHGSPRLEDYTGVPHCEFSPRSVADTPVGKSLDPVITSKWAYPAIQICKKHCTQKPPSSLTGVPIMLR